MEANSDVAVAQCSKLTRGIYLLALFFIFFPIALNVFQGIQSLTVSTTSTSMTVMGTSFFMALYIGAILFGMFRAYWIVSGKTRLESPYGGSLVSSLRNFGIALMYVGFFGQIAIYGSMLIHVAPGIFSIFAYPFQATFPFGLLLFEAARLMAFEEVGPNKSLNRDAQEQRAH